MVEEDLEAIDQLMGKSDAAPAPNPFAGGDIHPDPPGIAFTPPSEATPDHDLVLRIQAQSDASLETVRCYYKIVNQVLPFDCLDMSNQGDDGYTVTIPGTSIDARWDMMVFFEFVYADDGACRWPDWRQSTPYIVIPVDTGN